MIVQHFDESSRKWWTILIGLSIALLFAFILSISLGSVSIPIGSIVSFFQGNHIAETEQVILENFRIPKAITAMLVGAALGISGMQMQTLFRNALAGPYILGISSGAGLGAAIAIFTGFHFGSWLELSGISRSWYMVVSAGIGSFFVLLIMMLSSSRIRDGVTLLIIGMMFGAASSAIVSLLQFFSQSDNIQAYVIWSFGSLGSLSSEELSIFVPLVSIGLIASFALSKPLNALLLGENYAKSMGLNVKFVRYAIILNTTLLAGTVTAFCGPIAFLGIALPHITRLLFNTTNHLLLTPLIILFGGVAMLIFDVIAQLPGLESMLPINVVTSLFGAPFVIVLLLRRKNLNYTYG